VITTQAPARTALLLARDTEQHDLASLVREMGYEPVRVAAAESAQAIREPVALCIVDLRQNGEALRTVRAIRTQHPEAVVVGVADPERPTASADAIRAGVFDVLPRPASARDLDAILATHANRRPWRPRSRLRRHHGPPTGPHRTASSARQRRCAASWTSCSAPRPDAAAS